MTSLNPDLSDYGTVLEARINQSHSNTPNFGFVIFEDTKTVQHVLKVLVSVQQPPVPDHRPDLLCC